MSAFGLDFASAWRDLHHELVDTDAIEAAKSARLLESKEREMEYKMELEKMMLRVQMQPTLFQRQSRVIKNLIYGSSLNRTAWNVVTRTRGLEIHLLLKCRSKKSLLSIAHYLREAF